VAPKSAFEALRAQPRWLWAFAVTCVLGMTGAALQIPAGVHIATVATARRVASDPNLAGSSPEKVAQLTQFAVATQHWIWLIYPGFVLIALAFAAVIMLVGNALGHGSANFTRLFALAAHVAIVSYGAGFLVVGILSTLHPTEDFSGQTDLLKLVPCLAWAAPDASPRVTAILAHVNPFQIWSYILLAIGLRTVATLRPIAAYTTAAAVQIGAALTAAAFAR